MRLRPSNNQTHTQHNMQRRFNILAFGDRLTIGAVCRPSPLSDTMAHHLAQRALALVPGVRKLQKEQHDLHDAERRAYDAACIVAWERERDVERQHEYWMQYADECDAYVAERLKADREHDAGVRQRWEERRLEKEKRTGQAIGLSNPTNDCGCACCTDQCMRTDCRICIDYAQYHRFEEFPIDGYTCPGCDQMCTPDHQCLCTVLEWNVWWSDQECHVCSSTHRFDLSSDAEILPHRKCARPIRRNRVVVMND